MNKLRSNQIFAVLLGSAAFPLLCRTEPFTIEGIFGAAIATAVQLLLCIPILLNILLSLYLNVNWIVLGDILIWTLASIFSLL